MDSRGFVYNNYTYSVKSIKCLFAIFARSLRSLDLSLSLSLSLSVSLTLSPLTCTSWLYATPRLTDGVIVDGDVEEGARDLLELNSSEINGAALVLAGADVVGGVVGGASVNSKKRPATG